MVLKVRDENGNATITPITLDIFTPIPTLQNVSPDVYLSGILDTRVENEPIDFFRIRTSEIPKMFNS